MKIKIYLIIILFCLLHSINVLAWNALGHRLIAQIAYNHLTTNAKQQFNQYNQAMDKVYKPQSFVNAAVWLDMLRYQDINWFSTMHYVDLPFSEDGSQLPPLQDINAIWAIENATKLLCNKYAKAFDKGTALRVILHVVGDIHQPLHAATRVSKQFPQGDRGANLVALHGNSIAKNLHSYWDRGGGLLTPKHRYSQTQLIKRAESIERRWPCQITTADTNPTHWSNESHTLAINAAYKELPTDNIPDKKYRRLTKKIAEQQIAAAGCRLAAVLNECAKITQ